MFSDRKKLTTYQKEILLAYEADRLLLKVRNVNNKGYEFISKAIDYCWEWIEKRQVNLYDMLNIIEPEDGYDVLYYIDEFIKDENERKIYHEFFHIVVFIGGRALSYERYSIPYYFEEIYYEADHFDKIVNHILKIDPEVENHWKDVLKFLKEKRGNMAISIEWFKKSLDQVEPTFLEDDEEYSSIQKEVLILYVANEFIQELKGDEGYKSYYETLKLCLEWLMYREVDYEKLMDMMDDNNNKDNLSYYIKREENSRKKQIFTILLKIFKFELLQIMFYENFSLIDSLHDELHHLNYCWEELEREIIGWDHEWGNKLAKVFTLLLAERKREYEQNFSLRKVLRKL